MCLAAACCLLPTVYGDYESRWTAMLTGEGSLTLGVFCHAVAVFLRACVCVHVLENKPTKKKI